MSDKLKVVFMGTPDFSVPILENLIKNFDVKVVYTQPAKKAGRGQKITKTPVHNFAEKFKIEVRTPKSLRSEEEKAKFEAIDADIAVVAAYGLILPKEILEAFKFGCVNVHASLLPRWRGAAPIQRAIEAGDAKSGVTIMQMDVGLDTGDMILKDEVKIDNKTTGQILHDKLSVSGANLIVEALNQIADGTATFEKQDDSLANYAQKIEKLEGKIDFGKSVEDVDCQIRAFNPFPGSFFIYKDERFKVLDFDIINQDGKIGEIIFCDNDLVIACKKGSIKIKKIQRAGKKPMEIMELLNGFKFVKGEFVNG
jgi:methionyl-tRNA formyltransferase